MMKMINKILIANRGEIAVRIIKTARKLGIKSVAVYSEADTNSLAVQMADEAYYLGPSPSNLSYLNIPKIIEIIKLSDADSVHPGYGFLSENASFAESLEKMGVKFIGPNSESIRSMGDKIISKKIASEAKVNIVPGYMGIIPNAEKAASIAEKIGFPVMIKAAAGGGGRGMRIVRNKKDIAGAFASATKEAQNSFGDSRIFVEKFIEKPRHIEIQILGDQHGHIVCLGERECSIQRYNQKVIEESPSPFLTEKVRNEMYDQSKKLAKKVGYYSAGTVEYIVDQNRNFYFLEMNTRLQVEHPVTELVTGLDLVEQMIRIARGEKLSFTQKDIKLTGSAIESRIYAEDPSRGFMPSSGRISKYHEPNKGDNIRIDTGVYEGGEVSMFYDAMIAKLCSFGSDRNAAIENMQRALSEFVIEGISHNISFLESIFCSQRFASGDLSTSYISEEYPDGYKDQEIASSEYLELVYAAVIIRWLEAKRFSEITGKIKGREKEINTRWVVCVKDANYLVEINQLEESKYQLFFQGKEIKVDSVNWHVGLPLFQAVIDGVGVTLKFKKLQNNNFYRFNYLGMFIKVSVVSPRIAELMKYMPENEDEIDLSALTAPISGKVIGVKVVEGEKIKAGTELVIIEAMKMENSLIAERDVTIASVLVKEGENVQSGDILVKFS